MKVKKNFYMKWLIVDRLTRTRLMSLWNSEVGSSVQNLLYDQTIKQRFQNICGLKCTNLKALKVELVLNYKKKFRLKSLNRRFFNNNFTRRKEPVFLIYYLSFLLWHFHIWNWFGKNFFIWDTNLED